MEEMSKKQINMTDCTCPLQSYFTDLETIYGAMPGPDQGLAYSVYSGNIFLQNIINHMNYTNPEATQITFLAKCQGTDGSGIPTAALPTTGYSTFKTSITQDISQLTSALNALATSSSQLCGPFAILKDLITSAQSFLDLTTDIANFDKNAIPLFPTALYSKDSNIAILTQLSSVLNKTNKLANLVLVILSTYKSLCPISVIPQSLTSTSLKEQDSCLCRFSSIFGRWQQEITSSALTNLLLESSDALYSIPTALSFAGSKSLCPVILGEAFVLNLSQNSKIPNFVSDYNKLFNGITNDVNTFVNCSDGSCSPLLVGIMGKMLSLLVNLPVDVDKYLAPQEYTIDKAFLNGSQIDQELASVISLLYVAVTTFNHGCPTPPTVDPGCPSDIIPDIPEGDIEVTWCCKKCPKKKPNN